MLGIMIVDDEFLVRIGIRRTIDWDSHGFTIIGEAENGEEGLVLAKQLRPDIIITDIRMPNMDGLEFMSRLKETGVEAKIIVLSGYDEFDYARTALNHGALAYLLKPIENQELLDIVQTVGRKISKEREMTQHYRELEEELPDVKKYNLMKMIDGAHFSLNEADLKKIDFPLHDEKVLVAVRVDEYSLFQVKFNAQIAALRHAFLTINHERYQNDKIILLEHTVDEWIVILRNHTAAGGETVQAFCRRLLDLLYQRSGLGQGDVAFSLGISNPFVEIEGIAAAYGEARRAAEFKLLPGLNSIRRIDEVLQANNQTYIEQAIALIREDFAQDITIDSVAERLSVSASHLMHLFKNRLGKTFGDCLAEIRINAAKELLRDPFCRIYEVSEKVGYKDPKYFSQVFRRFTGLAPKDFTKLKNLTQE